MACNFHYLRNLDTSAEVPFFVDQYGRCLLLHGINVSGASKLPAAPYPQCIYPTEDAFWQPEPDFVGRPFARGEADRHFRRLKQYGITVIRLVVMWEAIETYPGIYNNTYLDYLEGILRHASEVGLLVIIDFHQDCWSRFTGGSGAPLWTLEVAGLNPRKLPQCGAVLLQSPSLEEYSEPGTLWATNYTKFAVNTMFTLFFAGEVFAPRAQYQGQNIGTLLRKRYIACLEEMAQRFEHISGVIGFDVMNEPHHGFIGMDTLEKFDEDVLLHLGEMPSAIQSMRLASGIPQKVPVYTTSWPKPTRISSYKLVNPDGINGWLPEREDIWQQHNVWLASAYQDAYFSCFPYDHVRAGQKVDFNDDFYTPFLHDCQRAIQKVMPRAWLFIEPIPNTISTPLPSFSNIKKICYAPHWYDLKALFEKKFSSYVTMNVQALSRGSRNLFAHTYFGSSQAIDNYTKQYATIFENSPKQFPRLVGETGIPFDMNHYYQVQKSSAKAKNDYWVQSQMLDIMCTAMERSLLSYTLWNYTPENRASKVSHLDPYIFHRSALTHRDRVVVIFGTVKTFPCTHKQRLMRHRPCRPSPPTFQLMPVVEPPRHGYDLRPQKSQAYHCTVGTISRKRPTP